MTLRVLDLFSGIGGFSLGLERTGGFNTVAFCEIDPFCRRVLKKHWPGVPIHEDVRTLPYDRIDAEVITAGFPCQDISGASRTRTGIAGARSGLFWEVVRAIRMVRPSGVLLENVADILDRGRGMGTVLGSLAEVGHDAEWDCLPAAAVGTDHERDRIFIFSHPHIFDGEARLGFLDLAEETIRAARDRNRASIWLAASRPPPGMADGVPAELDKRVRTEALGNAVVPQVVEVIGRAILAADAAQKSSCEPFKPFSESIDDRVTP